MSKNYALETLKNSELLINGSLDVLNLQVTSTQDNPGLRKELIEKRDNLRASIKTLEENKGLVVTDSEGGKMTINHEGVTFSGKIEVTPANATTNVDMDKYKWEIGEDQGLPIIALLNKGNEKFKEEVNNKVIKLDEFEIAHTQKFADLLLTLNKLDLDLESSIRLINEFHTSNPVDLIGHDGLGRPIYKK